MAVDRVIWKILLDVVVLGLVCFLLLAVVIWAEPYQRGYFPEDDTLRLPYKDNTVSEGVLAGVGFALNILTILTTEIIVDKHGNGVGERFLSGSLVPGWLWQSYTCIGVFTFGAACQQLTANVAKFVIGRLRPHFFDLCQPVPTENSPLNSLGYIQEFTCSGTSDPSRLQNMRLSFPSAHSSFAMYAAVFLIFYVQTKCRWHFSKLLRHGIQFAVLMGAWYVGLSRVSDHMHHWSDVAVGFGFGAIIAGITFVFVLRPKQLDAPEPWQLQQPRQEHMLPRPVLAR